MPPTSLAARRWAAALAAAIGGLFLTPVSTASAEPRPIHDHDAATIERAADPIVDPSTDTIGDAHIDSGLSDSIEAQLPTPTDRVHPERLLDACPILGASIFEDSWGWARSGGRRHEGVDLIAERGTPILAVRAGSVNFKHNRLGGKAVWLTALNGDRFYYAHLDAFNGESRDVLAGDVIGWVGSTGNAHGPHLHFETLPSGDVENPYPHTVEACLPTAEELEAERRAAARRVGTHPHIAI